MPPVRCRITPALPLFGALGMNSRFKIRRLYAALALLCAALPCLGQAFTLKGTIYSQVADELQIDPLLLYAVSIKASGKYQGGGLISPSPFVIRSSQLTKHFKSKEKAQSALLSVLETTIWVEVGLMQISVYYHPQEDPSTLLDPYINLTVGGRLLKTSIASSKDPVIGVGRYFTWKSEDESRSHGKEVWSIYSHIRALSFQEQRGTP